ncbi:MAG: ribbon-helix-helix domain-containing protein [Bacillota bacterium]
MSIFDYVKSSSPKVHTDFTQSNKMFTESNKEFTNNSPIIHEQFTQDEIDMIKEMLKSWQEVASTTQTNEQSLYNRVKQLPQSEKTRKTIVIDRVIGKRLDEFCEAERINKSDLLHLALADFLEKYEK